VAPATAGVYIRRPNRSIRPSAATSDLPLSPLSHPRSSSQMKKKTEGDDGEEAYLAEMASVPAREGAAVAPRLGREAPESSAPAREAEQLRQLADERASFSLLHLGGRWRK
jgi:hypothetical protein